MDSGLDTGPPYTVYSQKEAKANPSAPQTRRTSCVPNTLSAPNPLPLRPRLAPLPYPSWASAWRTDDHQDRLFSSTNNGDYVHGENAKVEEDLTLESSYQVTQTPHLHSGTPLYHRAYEWTTRASRHLQTPISISRAPVPTPVWSYNVSNITIPPSNA